jgi:hypothetical protein
MKTLLQKIASKLGYRLVRPVQKLREEANVSLVWDCVDRTVGRSLCIYDQILATKKVLGDVVECGVAHGDSLIFLMKASGEQGICRNFWGFDTFEGFPKTQKEDGEFLPRNIGKQKVYQGYTLDRLEARLNRVGISRRDFGNGQLVKGLIPDSFSSYSGAKVALLNVDLDLYAPTLATLNYFWPLMNPGGVVMLDEYDAPGDLVKWPGAKIAVDEFCQRNSVELKRHFTNRVFLVKP